MRSVTIARVMNGFVVTVGCQTLVFNTREELLLELGRYLADPQAIEAEYAKRFGYAPGDNGPGTVAMEEARRAQVTRLHDDPMAGASAGRVSLGETGCGTTGRIR